MKLLSIPLYYRTLVFKSITHPVISILAETVITVVIISHAYRIAGERSHDGIIKGLIIAGAGLMIGFSTHILNTAAYTLLNPLFTPKSVVSTVLFCGMGAWFALGHALRGKMSGKHYAYGSVINLVAVFVYHSVCLIKGF